jgi:hypothetical protein
MFQILGPEDFWACVISCLVQEVRGWVRLVPAQTCNGGVGGIQMLNTGCFFSGKKGGMVLPFVKNIGRKIMMT